MTVLNCRTVLDAVSSLLLMGSTAKAALRALQNSKSRREPS
jgi:hypothetical protein